MHDVIPVLSAEDRRRSLGWLAWWWIETFCVVGSEPAYDLPVVESPEYALFYVDCYALDAHGRRRFNHAFLSRPKGCDKSGKAGRLALFDALGPCRFAGWAEGGETYTFLGETYTYSPGEPMGRPISGPNVACIATTEDQSDNVYQVIKYNCDNGPLSQLKGYGLDVGETRILLPEGGSIRPLSSAPSGSDGGKQTMLIADEALALDTKLPTPSGWTTMRDVRKGDMLIGSDGSPVRVIKTTDVMERRNVYRVTFRNGDYIDASEGHMWMTRVIGSDAKPRVRTTGEMYRDGRKFGVPSQRGLRNDDIDLPLDPYILGVWLGDGDKNNATISTCPVDIDELERNIKLRGFTVKRLAEDRLVYVSRPGCVKGRFSPVEPVKTTLRKLGVLDNKHIPDVYMRAGYEQRLELLRGLLDTDGSCSKDGKVTFSNENATLMAQFRELAISLGQNPWAEYWQEDDRARSGHTGRSGFVPRGGIVPFSFQRKKARLGKEARCHHGKSWDTIASIEPIESVPVKCVAVDSPDHLFLAGKGWRVTHNTHLYSVPRLKSAYHTLRRNLSKRMADAEPWVLETTTMYRPGESSIAEETYRTAHDIHAGRLKADQHLLFDHRYSSLGIEDLSDVSKLKHGLYEAYGSAAKSPDGRDYLFTPDGRMVETVDGRSEEGWSLADPGVEPGPRRDGWVDVRGPMADILDPASDVGESVRYYLNSLTSVSDAWLSDSLIRKHTEYVSLFSRVREGTDLNEAALWRKVIDPDDAITLGFDGSLSDDATALVGCRVRDGLLFLIRLEQKPDGPEAADWRVNVDAFDRAARSMLDDYHVVGFFADVAYWRDVIIGWEHDYAYLDLVPMRSNADPIKFYTNTWKAEMMQSLIDMHTAFVKDWEPCDSEEEPNVSDVALMADPRLLAHFRNARRKDFRQSNPDGSAKYLIYKETPNSPLKIDACMAGVLAYAARTRYLERGRERNRGVVRMHAARVW